MRRRFHRGVSVEAALAEYWRVASGHDRFILRHLVWPTSRLPALRGHGQTISAVIDDGLIPDPELRLASIELKLPADLGSLAGQHCPIYIEIPVDGEFIDTIAEIGAAGLHAKVRCGARISSRAFSR